MIGDCVIGGSVVGVAVVSAAVINVPLQETTTVLSSVTVVALSL